MVTMVETLWAFSSVTVYFMIERFAPHITLPSLEHQHHPRYA